MPVIVKLPSGNWRAQVRRKRKYISNTFRRRVDADTWALWTYPEKVEGHSAARKSFRLSKVGSLSGRFCDVVVGLPKSGRAFVKALFEGRIETRK